MAVMQILTPNGSRTLELPSGLISIGRQGDNDVVIEDDRASRHHCTIQPFSGGYLLQDLGSRNGTRVNGERIDRVVLQLGEAFVIGKTILRVFADSVPPVELLDSSETGTDMDVPAPVAIEVDDDAITESDAASTPDQIIARARRDLNNLRTAGLDPGFTLDDVALVDCHGKAIHGTSGKGESGSEAVRTLRLLFYGAFRTRATDIHIDPEHDGAQVRFRVDGKMLPIVLLPKPIGRSILGVAKVLAEMDIAGRSTVHDGSFSVHVRRRVDCRIAIAPTMHGEKLVIRILDTAGVPKELHELGLPATMLKQIRGVCHLDAGMMIVSGPTGSGKTTTLYTALRSIDTRTRNVVTIENPIEYHLRGISQIQVDEKKGLTFSSILRSVLRQDPDVILVGEIRDKDTAQTAMQAAMTGHLVFTTLHARDTIGSLYRMLDLGVEAYMIANSVSVCLAQRLVRTLCRYCKKAFRASPSQLVQMKMENIQLGDIYTHVGCRRCMGVGYWGRTAIFELLQFNDKLRDALMTTKTIADIRRAAGEFSYQTLLESGYRKVADGVTTIEEVERVSARE
jgi:type II secretory ATPase GspE/PulE/Tfp pilus assembly ATPase PilB-like protein/pSer/pThr/pTyr-binding forkhead associated (FHA) protein